MTELKLSPVQQAHEAINTGAFFVYENEQGEKAIVPVPTGDEAEIDVLASRVAEDVGVEVWVYKPVSVYAVVKPTATAKVL